MALNVAEVWRYPAKSLQGEQLPEATVQLDGLAGDRIVHIRDAGGVITGRQAGRLIALRSVTGPAGEPLIEGHPWRSEAAGALVRAAAGPAAELAAWTGIERNDILPLLIATDGEVARWGADRRRRPNLLLSGAEPFEERGWPGQALRIGSELVVGVDSVRLRCIVVTYDPDTGEHDREHLRRVHREFGGRLALNCWVIQPGTVRRGDDVEVVDLDIGDVTEHPTHPGYPGWVYGATYAVP